MEGGSAAPQDQPVVFELRERGLGAEGKLPYTVRLMHFGEIFGQPELAPFMKKGTEADAVLVSEALIKACATARFIREGEHAHFDIADIARIAKRLTEEEEANDA
jgi:hypothetical protein